MRSAVERGLKFLLVTAIVGLISCAEPGQQEGSPLFIQVSSDDSGVTFANMIREDLSVNILTFEYLYNGGGVAIGDVTGDSLPDLFFTATQGANRLYKNLGGFRFEDITGQAGVAGRDSSMSTGATMADVNGDGNLDIYVCQTGKPEWSFDRHNLLYINGGDGTFMESAAGYGIDSESFSNQATFLDYDRDGDLDLYVVNHPGDFAEGNVVRPEPNAPEPFSSDQFFRNDGGTFSDVSVGAGIQNYAFGLSATVSDYNDDGWLDVYVANDYIQPDYLYLNDGNGTFSERGGEAMAHTSHFGMGSDVGDINNDGLQDIVVLDMMAEDARRQRLLASVMMYDRYQLQKEHGYGEQIMRNTLHFNNGDGTFSEIGQLAGISTTDWSWGPLLADFDNDGFRDLFVANGYRRDVTNLDYMQFTVDSLNRAGGGQARVSDIYEDYLDLVPTERLGNYAFRNRGDLTFEDVSDAWGLAEPSYSNGASYADLDADGDLDLIVNDIDGTARLYRNTSDEQYADRHWLRVVFDGQTGNRFGLGARVVVVGDSAQWVAENLSTRGFYSSVEPVVHFGLGDEEHVALEVTWPDGTSQRIENVALDQTMVVHYGDATRPGEEDQTTESVPFFDVASVQGLDFRHAEDAFVDFKRDPLLPHMHSREGPALAVADVNDDGLDDLYAGGAAGQAGQLFIQQTNGDFQVAPNSPFAADASSEDTRTLFFDANDDGAPDLYVASGGSHLTSQDETASAAYQDRLYLNDGQGGFHRADGQLPQMPIPTGAVASGDVDGDGDADLFVGGRLVPGRWPESPRSYLLINEGGRFSDETSAIAPDLAEVGLVTGSSFADVDDDGTEELLLVGEWMAPQVWQRSPEGTYELMIDNGLADYRGWWNTLAVADLDGDGDEDLLGGNLGLNSRIRGSVGQPVRVYANDFDSNGSIDAIQSLYYRDGFEYPIHRREAITQQLPYLQQRFPRYSRYAASTLSEVFPSYELEGALTLEAGWFSSTWFENDGAGKFIAHALPIEAQVAPIYAIVVQDVNGDGNVDLIGAGNNRFADVEGGPYDAGRGFVLLGDGQGEWEPIQSVRHGLALSGDVRSLVWLHNSSNGWLVVGNNDAPIQVRMINGGP